MEANGKVLFSTLEGVECALLLRDGVLEDLSMASADDEAGAGDIHVGRVQDVVPGLAAAFVEVGLARTGFLPLEEDRVPSKPLRKGDLILVRISRKSEGDKGARLTREIAIPGRSIVLIPQGNEIVLSKKINGQEVREQLKKCLQEDVPDGYGVVVRTVAESLPVEELLRELRGLLHTHEHLEALLAEDPTPRRLHQVSSLRLRVMRDWMGLKASEIWVETLAEKKAVIEALATGGLENKVSVTLPEGGGSLRRRFRLEKELDRLRQRSLWLPSGGSIVLDQTEAMTVIDVNSGKYSGRKKGKSLALKVNLEAATLLAKQIRLRGVGGIIVIDFIDMGDPAERKAVNERMNALFADDSVRTRILPMSGIGLVQMTRQRSPGALGPLESTRCNPCKGTGKRALYAGVFERIEDDVWTLVNGREGVSALLIEARSDIARAIRASGQLSELEKATGAKIDLVDGDEFKGQPFRVCLR